jgi:hypothetical protein
MIPVLVACALVAILAAAVAFGRWSARRDIRSLDARVRERETAKRDALELQRALRTTRDFNDSDAAGYIDRTGLEA